MATPQRSYSEATPRPAREGRTAIILNKNAKRVGERVRRKVVSAAPQADVFFTESLEQADFVTRRVVDSGYSTVVTGGGDGTVINTISQVMKHKERLGVAECPRFAVLKLGTGNAIADFLGARGYVQDLEQLEQAPQRKVNLINAGGQRTFFGGFGWDAVILNDYEKMKRAAERTSLGRAVFKTVAGYLVAGIGKSVPEFLIRRPRWKVRVVNSGGMGFRLDAKGEVIERFAPGATVYDGYARLACFGTTPYYGFKLNIMPFADKTPGMFQLRLIDMNPLTALWNLRSAWQGKLDHPGVTDLQLSGARLEFDRPAPLQIGGDAAGERQVFELGIDHPIECATWG